MDLFLDRTGKLSNPEETNREESEVNQLSPLADRLVGCFEHSDHAKPGFAVVDRGFIFGNAVDKVGQFTGQRFDLFDLRGPHVA